MRNNAKFAAQECTCFVNGCFDLYCNDGSCHYDKIIAYYLLYKQTEDKQVHNMQPKHM